MDEGNTEALVTWYLPEAYSQVLEIMDDAHTLPPSYESWRRGAMEQVARLRLLGRTPVPVPIMPLAFRAWCEGRGMGTHAEARIEYREYLASREEPTIELAAGGVDRRFTEVTTRDFVMAGS